MKINFSNSLLKNVTLLGFTAFLAILDFASKSFVLSHFDGKINETIEVTGFFNIVLVRNLGISFGLFSSYKYSNLAFAIAAIAILILLIWLFFKEKTIKAKLAYCLIMAGAIGNLVDRKIYGAVIDFLDFHLYEYHWPAFNLADSLIFLGVATLLIIGAKNENKN